jgi:hypothetical protein
MLKINSQRQGTQVAFPICAGKITPTDCKDPLK